MRTLDLVSGEEPGRQRWAVALPPFDHEIRWSAVGHERWSVLREMMGSGQIPVTAVEIEVV